MRITVYASTNIVGSRQETVIDVPDKEWEAMPENERDALCFDAALQLIDWGYQ